MKPISKSIGISAPRRRFLRGAVSVAPVMIVAGSSAAAVTGKSGADYSPTFFTAEEWPVLMALADRIIPRDAEGPGALDAGVHEFIDRQMATEYGYGKLWYMEPPFVESNAEFGYQLALSPRDLYRAALKELSVAVQRDQGKSFAQLADADKDKLISGLEQGAHALGSVPSKVFFAQLLQNVHEGYFCDPKYGGNKDMAAWAMIGFPGARADYIDWVEQYGKKYPFPPVSSS